MIRQTVRDERRLCADQIENTKIQITILSLGKLYDISKTYLATLVGASQGNPGFGGLIQNKDGK